MTRGREIFIFKMNALRIKDLAEVMIEELAPNFGHNPRNINIEIVGPRPGERVYEALMTKEEAYHAIEMENLFILRPKIIQPHYAEKENNGHPIALSKYNARYAEFLSKEEIKKK